MICPFINLEEFVTWQILWVLKKGQKLTKMEREQSQLISKNLNWFLPHQTILLWKLKVFRRLADVFPLFHENPVEVRWKFYELFFYLLIYPDSLFNPIHPGGGQICPTLHACEYVKWLCNIWMTPKPSEILGAVLKFFSQSRRWLQLCVICP